MENSIENIFDFRSYLERILNNWRIVLTSFIICFGIAFLYLRYTTPQYHISAKLLIEDEKKGNGNWASVAPMDIGKLMGAGSSVDNEIEVIKTRYLMDRLVRRMQLNFIWYRLGDIRDVEIDEAPVQIEIKSLQDTLKKTEIEVEIKNKNSFLLSYEDPESNEKYSLTFSFNKDFTLPNLGRFIFRNDYNLAGKKYKLLIRSVDSQVSNYRKLLTADVTNKLASTIDLQFDYPLTKKGEQILNEYIAEYIQQNRRDKSKIADSTIAFIDDRILLVNSELNRIEDEIQLYMQGKGLANIAEQSKLLFQSSNEHIKQLADVQAKIEVIDAVEKLLQQENNKRLVAGTVLTDDPSFSTLMSSYNNLNLEKERLLLSFTPDNPYVANVNERIESVKQNILTYLRNSRSNLEVSRKEIEKNVGNLQGNIKQVPAQQRAFLALSRQQQLKQELYLFLLQKREETAVANTSNIAGIRIIDPPKAMTSPFSPNRIVVYFMALLFASLIPIAKIYLEDLLNNKVNNRVDIEKRTKVPIIAEFSHNTTGTDLINFELSRSVLAEQFRALRTNLRFMMPQSNDKAILITSGVPGEGKSFTSLNLATVYAVSGKKVLLLEFDLRKPKLSKIFTHVSETGISNYIVDQSLSLDDIITPIGDSKNLYFGPCGPIPPNPAELILSERVDLMMREARKRFDYIVIDAPPIGVVTDGQLLSTYSDVVLYVVRANYTLLKLTGLPEEIRRDDKMKNMAIVLNDVTEKNSGGYYYGYNYGYYHADERKQPWWKLK